MFLTATSLANQYGIDETIAKFYVDREPPKDNLYWKDKLLYLRPQPGYIFLPLITDLFFKSGVSKDELLSESFVSTLEQIGHLSAQHEFGTIGSQQVLQSCIAHVHAKDHDQDFLQQLISYFKGEDNFITASTTTFKALHRGDVFLFALCLLDVDERKKHELVKTWFALISTLLLMDDAEDVESDEKNNEENAFIESGGDKEGFEKIKQLLSNNLDHISTINKTMANALHRNFTAVAEKPFIKEYLKA